MCLILFLIIISVIFECYWYFYRIGFFRADTIATNFVRYSLYYIIVWINYDIFMRMINNYFNVRSNYEIVSDNILKFMMLDRFTLVFLHEAINIKITLNIILIIDLIHIFKQWKFIPFKHFLTENVLLCKVFNIATFFRSSN